MLSSSLSTVSGVVNLEIVMLTPNYSRSTSANSTYTVTYSGNNPSNVPPGSGPVGSSETMFESQTQASVNTPGFARLKKNQRPFNNFSKSIVKQYDSPQTMTQSYLADSGLIGDFKYSSFTVSLNGGLAYRYLSPADELYQKLVAQVMRDISLGKTDLGVTLAEANKTAAMIASTATRLAGAMRGLRRGDIGDLLTSLGITASVSQRKRFIRRKKLAWTDRVNSVKVPRTVLEAKKEKFARDTWLEYQYGWKPLLAEVHSSAKALASLAVDKSQLVRTVKHRGQWENFRERTDYLRNVSFRTSMRATLHGELFVGYTIDGGSNFDAVMGLNNPLTIAWELVPFSFVVDWFLPIGQAIEGLTAYSGLTFKGGYYSKRWVIDEQVQAGPGNSWRAGGVVWSPQGTNGRFDCRTVLITRSGLSAFPSYGWPAFKNPLSVSHMVSSLALLSATFRK